MFSRSNIFIFLALINMAAQAQTTERNHKPRRADSFFGVHFDLHASEDITDAGRSLTYAMVDTFLTKVRPDFIQIDCKGHPGISSYPTKAGFHVNGFEKDPLKLFREVTEKNGVALYMHYSGVWDSKAVREHPAWAMVNANGERSTRLTSFFSPYLDSLMIPQLKELSSVYHVDGAWIDGECWAVEPDWGQASLNRFTRETGITDIPRKPGDKYYPEFLEFTRELFREHLMKYIDAIHEYDPGFQVTSNWSYSSLMPEKVAANVDFLSGDVTPQNGVYRSAFEARCLASQGKPWDLMAWGFSWDGGEMPMNIKSAVQLEQEASEIMAMGGGVQFYFQQNRDLSIKPWIAGMMADIGKFCRERQEFCHKAVPVPQIALLYPAASYQRNASTAYAGPTGKLQGALYSILDGQHPVEIRMEHNLTGKKNSYPLIIVPECDFLDGAMIEEMKDYVKNGGNLLLIGPDASLMFTEELGIESAERSQSGPAFITAGGRIGAIRPEILKTRLGPAATALSMFYDGSDFRDKSAFPSASVASIGKGKIAGIYFNAGTLYSEYRNFVLRDFISEVIDGLMPEKIAEVTGSSLVHVALNRLGGKLYVSLVNTAGDHMGKNTIGYDEIPVVNNLTIRLKLPVSPSKIILQPEGKELKISRSNGFSVVRVPELSLYSILEVL